MQNLRRQNGEAGSTLIEFAVVAMLYLMLLFGIVDVGRALYAYDFVCHAAREGTRYAMVRGISCTGFDSACPATASDIQTYLRNNAPGIDSSALTVIAGCYEHVAGPPCGAGDPVWVQVHYRFGFISPFIPTSWVMSSSSQIVVSQ
jgi:TadE-like protein